MKHNFDAQHKTRRRHRRELPDHHLERVVVVAAVELIVAIVAVVVVVAIAVAEAIVIVVEAQRRGNILRSKRWSVRKFWQR